MRHTPSWFRRAVVGLLVAVTLVLPGQPVMASSTVLTIRATIVATRVQAGYTLIGTTKTGRVILVQPITGASTTVNSKTPALSGSVGRINQGISFHLLTKTGQYYGPVVVGWNMALRSSSTRVATHLQALLSSPTILNLGTINILAVSAGQGIGYTHTKLPSATVTDVYARAGVPVGVGSYGKSAVPRVGTTSEDFLAGADADHDGITNTYDISDDGDAVPDPVDLTGRLKAPNAGTWCDAVGVFTIESSLKANNADFSNTRNYYAEGTSALASSETLPGVLAATMNYHLQTAKTICGSAVEKTEIRSLGLPYLSTSAVTLPRDETPWSIAQTRWNVTSGTMNDNPVTGLTGYEFSCDPKCQISGNDAFLVRYTTANGKTYEYMGTPQLIPLTHPMLVAYKVVHDVSATACSSTGYTTNAYDGTAPAGSVANRISISSAADETLCLMLFRPQRAALPGERTTASVGFYDIGALSYLPDIAQGINNTGERSPGRCTAATVSDGRQDRLGAPTGTLATNPTVTVSWKTAVLKTCLTNVELPWSSGTLDLDIIGTTPVSAGWTTSQRLFLTIAE